MTGRNLLTPLKNGVLKYILFDKLPFVGLCILCVKMKTFLCEDHICLNRIIIYNQEQQQQWQLPKRPLKREFTLLQTFYHANIPSCFLVRQMLANFSDVEFYTNKNTLSSIESHLLGDKFCCQRRRCCYTTFSFGIQNECYKS